ncbi:MAG: MBL fold metallo-hydrolase, partial [Candidatus Micrarchaeaceae archaeon]
MILKFFGSAQEVGRSSIMLKDEKSLMMDYGVKLNHKTEYPVGMPKVDAVVLSHAHMDHSGDVPALYNEMLIPTFGTIPTLKLSQLLLEDSMKLWKKQHQQPRFHKRQLGSFINRFVSLGYHSPTRFNNMSIEFYDAAHISGSAVTLIERKNATENKRIVYTGDYKIQPQALHKGAEIVESDVLITESTYATRQHPDREQLVKSFIAKVKETLDNGGTALVPVFAVGRSQEVLAILHRHGLAGRTYIDGMARAATSIVLKYPEFILHHSALAAAAKEAVTISDQSDRLEAMNEPSIILTTAGMLNGGPVLNYITRLKKNSHILLTGYQLEGTNGRTLLEKGEVFIDGETVKIDTPA